MSEEYAWGTEWLTAVAQVLGVEDISTIERIELSFRTGDFPFAALYFTDGEVVMKTMSTTGIVPIKEALGLPHIAQKIAIVIEPSQWVKMHLYYQFVPGVNPLDEVLGVIQAGEWYPRGLDD